LAGKPRRGSKKWLEDQEKKLNRAKKRAAVKNAELKALKDLIKAGWKPRD